MSLLCVAAIGTQPRCLAAQPQHGWYVVRIGDSPAGWMRASETRTDSGTLVLTRLHLVLNRLGKRVSMEMTESALEDQRGTFLRTAATTRLSEQATETRAWLDGDSVRVSAGAGGRWFTRAVASGGPLVGSAAAMQLTARTLRQPGDSVVFRTLQAALAAPVAATRILQSIDTLAIAGRRATARRILERSPASPVPVTMWIDENGRLLRTAYPSPFGLTVSELADSATALLAGSGAELRDDQYARTIVRTGVRLPQSRRLRMLRLAISADSMAAWPSLAGPGQRVLSSGPGSLVLEVTSRRAPVAGQRFPVAAPPALREYLEPNAYVQSDDSTLRALARNIAGDERDAWQAALSLQRWVADSMQFDAGIAFASSAEILQRRRGTCIAYATILATLTRSLGIPSRVAFGFVYVNGMLGGHAWTEVHIDGAWHGLDAAIVPYGPLDAARFAFAWGSLAAGAAELTNAPGARLYNGLRARVLAYQVDGAGPVAVDTTALPHVVEGDRYRNTTLGIAFTKPAGYRWEALDETWPGMGIARAVTPGGDSLRVLSYSGAPWQTRENELRRRLQKLLPGAPPASLRVRGRPAVLAESNGRAAIALSNGSESLVIETVGADAGRVVRHVAESLQLPW